MRRATVDLPQPDSPTSDSVSPRLMVNETPSTAFRIWRGAPSITRFNQGRDTSKKRARSETSSSVSAMHRPFAPILRSTRRLALGVVQPARRAREVGRKQARALDAATVEDARAARVEGAPRGNGVQPRHRSLDLREALDVLADCGNRPHEAGGVGVLRIVDHLLHRA